jgi:hypothetical protein
MYNFILGVTDTDSISFCKQDQSPFSVEEQNNLIAEINGMMPELIKYDHDGCYKKVVIIRAKNYILQTFDDKIKIRGSALKATGKEVALREFIGRIINCLLEDRQHDMVSIYNEYVKEILNVKDIGRWASKKTITETVLKGERTTEQKVLNSIEGSEYGIGDKIYTYFNHKDEVVLQENWNNDHNIDKLLEKLYKTLLTFETVLDKNLFLNYKLKRNKKLLELL